MKLSIPLMIIGLLSLSTSNPALSRSPQCIAHRGFHYSALENSSTSILNAASAKIDGIEFDVRHTKDGKGLLVHNRTLRYIAKSKPYKRCPKEAISLLNYSEISESCILKNGEAITTIDESFKLLKGKSSPSL